MSLFWLDICSEDNFSRDCAFKQRRGVLESWNIFLIIFRLTFPTSLEFFTFTYSVRFFKRVTCINMLKYSKRGHYPQIHSANSSSMEAETCHVLFSIWSDSVMCIFIYLKAFIDSKEIKVIQNNSLNLYFFQKPKIGQKFPIWPDQIIHI